MIRTILAGIDVGSQTTRIVVCEKKSGEYPRVLGVGTAPSLGMHHGYITNIKLACGSIKQALAEAEKSAGVRVRQVMIGIGGITLGTDIGLGSAIISKADSEITHLDVKKALDQSEESIIIANKKIIDSYPIAYRLDGKELLGEPEGMKGVKLEVRSLFVTALGQHIDSLIVAVSDAGLEVIDVVPAPVASAAGILSDKQRMAGCVLANFGAETLSTIVYEDNKLVSLQIFPIGGNDITNDIALGLKIPLEEADGIKIGSIMSNTPKKKLDEIVNARLEDMFDLIDAQLKKIRRNGLLPAGAILIGGSSQFPMIDEAARAALRLPAKFGIDILVERTKGKLRDTAFAVAYGLCVLDRDDTAKRRPDSSSGLLESIKQFFLRIGNQLLP